MSARTNHDRLVCPACQHVLTRRDQARMYPFWRGLQATPCAKCGRRLRWHPDLHRTLRFGAWTFRFGMLLAFASLIAATVSSAPWTFLFSAIAGAWIALLGGILAVPRDQGKWLEIEDA